MEISEKDIISAIRKQMSRHPNCMNSHSKWDGYKDRPFSSDTIHMRFGWRRAKEILGLKCVKRKYSDLEIIDGIKQQFMRHPDCLTSLDKWDSYVNIDRPFCSSVVSLFGLKKAKALVGLKIRGDYSKQEVIDAVKRQLKKHIDCMNSCAKWDCYTDKPFGSRAIRNYGWIKIKTAMGFKCQASRRPSMQEIMNGVITQFNKHPACMNSDREWDSYKDKPFCSLIVYRFGWSKSKFMLGLPLNMRLVIDILRPLIIAHRDDPTWLADVFELLYYHAPYSLYYKRLPCFRYCAEKRIRKIIKQNREYSEDDMKWAKKYFMSLIDKWKRSSELAIVA